MKKKISKFFADFFLNGAENSSSPGFNYFKNWTKLTSSPQTALRGGGWRMLIWSQKFSRLLSASSQ